MLAILDLINNQNNNSVRALHFLGTFRCRHCTTRTSNFLNERFMEDVNKRRSGIIVTTFEKTRIHFNSDVYAAVTIVVSKAPYYSPAGKFV